MAALVLDEECLMEFDILSNYLCIDHNPASNDLILVTSQ